MYKVSRPIRIDKTGIRQLATRLTKSLKEEAEQLALKPGNLDKKLILLPENWDTIWWSLTTVRGIDTMVRIALRTIRGGRNYEMIPTGAFEDGKKPPSIYVFVNGESTLEELLSMLRGFPHGVETQIYKILIHEVTHAMDDVEDDRGYGVSDDMKPDNPTSYYNDPKEVRAFMQQVVDEILTFDRNRGHIKKILEIFGSQKGFKTLLNSSDTWKQGSQHWTSANRQKILKSVFQSLSETGHI